MNSTTLSRRIIATTIIIFTSSMFCVQIAFSQTNLPDRQAYLDSLWTVWEDHTKPDMTRLEALQEFTKKGYHYSQPDSAYYFSQLQYDFAKSKGLKKQMAKALNIQGVSSQIQGDYTSAIDYYTRSLTIHEEIKNKRGIAGTLNNIGIIYKKQGDYTNAIDYYTRSLTIKEEIGDKRGIASSLNNIGVIYNDQGDYASAIDYYTRSLTIREEIGDKKGVADSYTNIGNFYNAQGDYSKVITYSSRALIAAQEVGAVIETSNAAKALYESYKAMNRQKLALEMYELYITTRDSINNEANLKEVIRQEYKYEYEKHAIADSISYVQVKKVQEAKLEKSRILQYALIGGVTLLLAFLGYVFNRYRVTQKQKLIISEQNKELVTATELAESANNELKTKSEELEKFNNVMLDREMRIIELKKEVNIEAKPNDTEIPYPEFEDV